MNAISKRESQEFLKVLGNIKDEKTRYFFLMLGEAIGEAQAAAGTPQQVNTSPDHIADLQRRING